MFTIKSNATITKKSSAKPRTPKITLNITKEVIEDAVIGDSSHCMIAEALRDHFVDARSIAVDLQTIRYSDKKKGLRYTYLTPRIAQQAIVKFDQGIEPEPFQFRLSGGQVTSIKKRLGEHITSGPKTGTPAIKAASAKGSKVAEGIKLPKRVSLVNRSDNGAKSTIPDIVGGQTPPMMKTRKTGDIPFSRRRQFGLRALERTTEENG